MPLVNLMVDLFYTQLILRNGDAYSYECFRKYSKGYLMTNENIKAYLEQENYILGRALTILGSGDHVFNLVLFGFPKIDAMDINKLEYYVYSLKKAAINTLDYLDYIKFIDSFNAWWMCNFEELLEKLKNNLSEDVYAYFRFVIECSKKSDGIGNLYYYGYKSEWMKGNAYLTDEDSYLSLRRKLLETEINLHFGDARKIELNNTYDLILLSNIADYFGTFANPLSLEEYKVFIKKYYE